MLEGTLVRGDAYFENLTFWRDVLQRRALIREWVLIRSFTVLGVMCHSIPAVSVFPGRFAHTCCLSLCALPAIFLPGGPGFRLGQIFPEIDENLGCIFIFSRFFQEAIKNSRKNTHFVYSNCICLLEDQC